MSGHDTSVQSEPRTEERPEDLILAVDDRPANLIALERVLGGISARIIKATSGEEALAACLKYQFAVAILDVQMPGMDGYELAEILLADPATARTPIIFVTAAYSDEAHRFKGYSAGAVDYMVKPYDPAILFSKVKVFLELARHRRDLEGIISERTRALRASELRYRTLFETMAQGVVYQDADGKIIDANPAAVRILGLPADRMLQRDSSDPHWQAIREDGGDFPGDEHPTMVALRTGRAVHDVVMGLRRPDEARERWIKVSAIPQFLPGERAPSQVYATFSDITARRAAEQAVEDSERALRAVFESTLDGILVADEETLSVQFVNDSLPRLLGRAGALVPAAKLAEMRDRFRDAGQAQHQILDMVIQRADGAEVVVDVSVTAVDLGGRRCLLGVFRDMTERRRNEVERQRLQSELMQSQKMDSVGLLAGGIAHDFNNLLTVILGYVALVLDSGEATETARADLLEVQRAAERSAELTRQLLAFGRKQSMERSPLDLNEVARNVDKLLGRIIGDDVDLSFQLAPDLGLVSADQGQIEQVIMNLSVNARDAMPKGGMLLFTTANIEVDHEMTRRHPELVRGSYVRLAVSDTGCGMDAPTLARIFEPFFTTKPKNKGTGLGLSMVYGIVKQSDGHLTVESEVGKGTTFSIYLARMARATMVSERPLPIGPEKQGGGETILVVEDSDQLRAYAARALRAAGYKVVTAIDGVDALRVYEASAEPIELVLTDVVMPRMGGHEFSERLLKVHADAKVLFMSGHTGTTFMVEGVFEPPPNFVEKPFLVGALLRKVRDALDGRVPAE